MKHLFRLSLEFITENQIGTYVSIFAANLVDDGIVAPGVAVPADDCGTQVGELEGQLST